MNIIFLHTGITSSLIPILTLIENKPELIVGCVLLGGEPDANKVPGWFIDSTLAENPAAELLEHIDKGRSDGFVLRNLDVFLVVKEPGSFLQISVLAAVGCCNLNYSGTGGGGGRKVLELLSNHNIRTYPAEVPHPVVDGKNLSTWQLEAQEAFEESFNVVAPRWLPECWELPPARY